ncbi:formate dehydrogenase [Aureimonas fodinaquatilis]|uniref:Formate dehydrogenase n=1 Tax=Aureimonas fodinaquatilis TaxID=2565783 RepID=A0A5B0DY03_9HYPH|nr:formate dehydrogenase beta subunit [Aureimonas fodinaquatilis]KAA0970631.1 formate dehydrogenase [Aureimonas fodinaquatilis]
MRQRIFVPGDAAAVAMGADDVASAIDRAAVASGRSIELVRNGSRGAHFLEPLVEVETPQGRIGYGPVMPEDISGLISSGLFEAAPHPLCIGNPDEHKFLKPQIRSTFALCGIVDPRSESDYARHGGWAGLRAALAMAGEDRIGAVKTSGLRGRGGAGFPTGIKWETVFRASGPEKYVVCNADEGDSGTFADRMLMEGDPFRLVEGMAICGVSVGANYGYIYIRSEYPHAIAAMERAIIGARRAGWLGQAIGGSDLAFDMEVRVGAGAYVCGEETSLLNSIEGKRGVVRAKPPLPALQGLFGKPTVINNVLSLGAVPALFAQGPDQYQALGFGRSRGTMPVQLAGNIRYGGLYEVPFGITLGELVETIGGGTASGRPVRAVQVGGPLGAYFPPSLFDTPFDYEAFAARDGLIGHGGITVFDDTVDMAIMARFALEFCAIESCGKCTPCRIGAVRGQEVMDRVIAARQSGADVAADLSLLTDLCETMKFGSLCALGGFTPYPVSSAMRHFPEDFQRGVRPLPASLAVAG